MRGLGRWGSSLSNKGLFFSFSPFSAIVSNGDRCSILCLA